jgi:hypothetical protein
MIHILYINLLLFLQKFIYDENKLLKNIIKNEINSILLLRNKEISKNSNENLKKTSILNNNNYSYECNNILTKNSDNQNQFDNDKIGYQDNNQKQFNITSFDIPLYYKFFNFFNNYKQNNCQDFYNKQQQNFKYEPKKYHTAKYMDFYSINNFMQNDSKLSKRYNEIVKEELLYEEGSNSLKFGIIGFFKRIFRIKESENTDTIKRHLKLIPFNEGKFEEKTILILISGYLSSKDNHFKEWKQLINVYQKRFNNPIIYFYNWPSSNFSLKKLIFHRKDFRDARERAGYCGKLLALFIMSDIFNGFKINLSAFSLGNHVLKHCLKELEDFDKLSLINNVVFMAGATEIKCNFKWEHRLGSVTGTIVNCYSDHDLALWYCRNITKKDTIGTKKLKFAHVKVLNRIISSFHILYRINMDQLWNMFINDLKE